MLQKQKLSFNTDEKVNSIVNAFTSQHLPAVNLLRRYFAITPNRIAKELKFKNNQAFYLYKRFVRAIEMRNLDTKPMAFLSEHDVMKELGEVIVDAYCSYSPISGKKIPIESFVDDSILTMF